MSSDSLTDLLARSVRDQVEYYLEEIAGAALAPTREIKTDDGLVLSSAYAGAPDDLVGSFASNAGALLLMQRAQQQKLRDIASSPDLTERGRQVEARRAREKFSDAVRDHRDRFGRVSMDAKRRANFVVAKTKTPTPDRESLMTDVQRQQRDSNFETLQKCFRALNPQERRERLIVAARAADRAALQAISADPLRHVAPLFENDELEAARALYAASAAPSNYAEHAAIEAAESDADFNVAHALRVGGVPAGTDSPPVEMPRA